MSEWIDASAVTLAKAIRAREVSSRDVVEACLARIEQVNARLNAVVQIDAESALLQARQADDELARGQVRGPLHGVPMTIKDSLDTAGMVTTAGSKGRAGFVPKNDATVVSRLRAAGAILIGKTNTPELTLAYETDNLVYGRTNNPYDLSRTSGGSSGGAAAIVAAGGSPFDIGSDTGGSIRVPAHFNGIAGIRPTSGRVPRTGHMPPPGGAMEALTQLGPLARTVQDLIVILPIIAGIDWRDPAIVPIALSDPGEVDLAGLSVAFHTDNGIATPVPEIRATVEAAARALDGAGLAVVRARPPGIEQAAPLWSEWITADGGAGIRALLQMCGTDEPHPWTQRLIDHARAGQITVAEFGGLLARLDMFRSQMLSFIQQHDLILCPVSAHPALPHGAAVENVLYFSYTFTYNLTGWPAVVVPVGATAEGLPIGVQVVARPWREDVALKVAQFLENTFGGWRRPPL
ncbi:MAG: amidase [Anaerolineae bacterium]|nr:amidase [Anaerolineae bacterium]